MNLLCLKCLLSHHHLLQKLYAHFYLAHTLPQIFCLCTYKLYVCVLFLLFRLLCVFSMLLSLVKQKYVIYSIGFRWKCLVATSNETKSVCARARVFVFLFLFSFTMCMCSISNPIHTVHTVSIISPNEYDFNFFSSVFSFVSMNTSNKYIQRTSKRTNKRTRRWFISQLHLSVCTVLNFFSPVKHWNL